LVIAIMSGKGHELKPFNWCTRDKKDLNKIFDKKATNKTDCDAPEYTKLIGPLCAAVKGASTWVYTGRARGSAAAHAVVRRSCAAQAGHPDLELPKLTGECKHNVLHARHRTIVAVGFWL
jgi:hypothetical protein